MSLLDTLKQIGVGAGAGAAAAAGNDMSLQKLEERRKKREALTDEQRKQGLQLYDQAILGIRDKMGTVDPKSAEYTQLQQGLQKAVRGKTMLYHPALAPVAYKELAGLLGQGAPSKPEEKYTPLGIPYQDPNDKQWYQSFRDVQGNVIKRAMPEGYQPKQGPKKGFKYDAATDEVVDQDTATRFTRDNPNNPQEVQDMFKGQATAAAGKQKPRYAWKRDPKSPTGFTNVKLDANNKAIPGTENSDLVPPSNVLNSMGKTTTGYYHYVDEKGQVHQIQETKTTQPISAGGAVPKTAGEAKATAKKNAGARAQAAPDFKDTIIGFKGSKDYNETKAAWLGAIDRQKTMDENLKDALETGNQQAMLSLVANHIGMTLGAQRGARITRAVWDEAIHSAPWTQTWYAKAFHEDRSGEMVFDGWKSGVTLTGDQMRQMVQLGHEKVRILKEHLDYLDKERGAAGGGSDTGGDMINVQIPGQPPGKIHRSQKDAFLKKYPNATVSE